MLLAVHTVAMLTYCVTKMITHSPMIGKIFDIIIEASTEKEWLCYDSPKSKFFLSAGNCFEPP